MNPQIYAGTSWHTIRTGKVYIGAGWRVRTRRMAYLAGAWKQTAAYVLPLTGSAPDVFGETGSNFPVTVTSNYTTATPAGGLAPFTYSWSAPGYTISNPTMATTFFSKVVPPFNDTFGSASCTITDALGSTANVIVSIELSNTG